VPTPTTSRRSSRRCAQSAAPGPRSRLRRSASSAVLPRPCPLVGTRARCSSRRRAPRGRIVVGGAQLLTRDLSETAEWILADARAAGGRFVASTALCNLASALQTRGDLAASEPVLEEARAIAREGGKGVAGELSARAAGLGRRRCSDVADEVGLWPMKGPRSTGHEVAGKRMLASSVPSPGG
jgi:hypothetical protein